MQDELEKLAVKPEEAFRMLGIGRSLGWRLIWEGRIPSVRLGKRTLVPVSGLKRILREAK